jgi:hypothetical protein
VLPYVLILSSSIVVGFALFTGRKGGEMAFAAALPCMPSRGLTAL